MAELQNKMLKNMDEVEWGATLAHCRIRRENMADFAARAFRQMRERDLGGPRYTVPEERQAELRELAEPPRGAVSIGSAAELAALMQGVAAMAQASGRPVPRDVMREASAAARDAIRAARGKAPVKPRDPPWPQQRALPAPSAAR